MTWFLLSLFLIKVLFEVLNRYIPDTISFALFSILFWMALFNPNVKIFNVSWLGNILFYWLYCTQI